MTITVNNFIINGEVQPNVYIEDTVALRHPKNYDKSHLEDTINIDDTEVTKANNAHHHHFGMPQNLFVNKNSSRYYKKGYFGDMVRLSMPNQHLKVSYKKDEVTHKTMKSSYERLLEE